jgi:DNA-binding PadR family transcriptional regulator
MSPVFRHGRLRLYLLRLLDEEPRHGYEVIRLLRDRFMGIYAPSPGTIYPRLARLEEEGLVTHDEEKGRKVYRITEAGREELRKRSTELDELEEELSASVNDIVREVREDVRDTVRTLREELTWAAREMRRGEREERGDVRDQARQTREQARQTREQARQTREQAKEEAREQARATRDDARRHAQRIREEAAHLRDEAVSWLGLDWQHWGDWSGHKNCPGPRDMAAFRDLENLARDFASDMRKVAWESESLGGDVISSLRDLLEETLERIKIEVLNPYSTDSSKDGGETGEEADDA